MQLNKTTGATEEKGSQWQMVRQKEMGKTLSSVKE